MGTNKIICNSFEIQSTERSGDDMIGFLWLDHCLWKDGSVAGLFHKKECVECGGLKIYYGSYGSNDHESICEMSELGCAFFDLATGYPNGWNDMLRDVKTTDDLTLTKIGLVFEDHEHLLDGVLNNLFASDPWPLLPAVPKNVKATAHKEIFQGKQEELYAAYGENSDDIQVRFKQSQPRGLEGYFNGIGVELTLRRDLAKGFVESSDDIGGFLARNLEDYFCDLCVPPYWDELMTKMKQIERFSAEYDRGEPAAT